MPKKMPGRLVALSASAVAVIYLAGLATTQPSADTNVAVASTGADTAPVATDGAPLTSTATPIVVVGASAASATATPTQTSTVASTYANGTYAGTGTSRFGNVAVSVTVSAGKITNVQITRVTTSYPVSRIASLPAQVVQRQTANVNAVTGATYSSQAFKQAVQQALALALAANSTAASG